jgi:hypothetical protein
MLELIRTQPGFGSRSGRTGRCALPRVITNTIAVAQDHRPGRVHCPTLFFAATRDEHTTELTAVRFADTYGVNLPLDRIVATPTIAKLAELLAASSIQSTPTPHQ